MRSHKRLKKLSINYYGNIEFPNWSGEHSYGNVVMIRLKSCKKISSLPPLGQLPSLKNLHIEKLDGVRRWIRSFMEILVILHKPFGPLETLLTFEGMLKWRKWDCAGVEFPCLEKLYMRKCPKLGGDLPKHLPLLMELHISECQQLANPLPMVPSICKYKGVTFWSSYQREWCRAALISLYWTSETESLRSFPWVGSLEYFLSGAVGNLSSPCLRVCLEILSFPRGGLSS